MFRLLLLVFAVAMAGWVPIASAQSEGAGVLRQYSYPANGLSISAPAAPDIHPDAQAPDVTIYRWQLAPDVIVVIHVGNRPDCSAVLSQMKSAARSAGMEPRVVVLNGKEGVETDTSRSGQRTLERVYCAGEKAYGITAKWPQQRPIPTTVTKMFESFHITGTTLR